MLSLFYRFFFFSVQDQRYNKYSGQDSNLHTWLKSKCLTATLVLVAPPWPSFWEGDNGANGLDPITWSLLFFTLNNVNLRDGSWPSHSAGGKFASYTLFSSERGCNLKLATGVGGGLMLKFQCFPGILLSESLQKPTLWLSRLRPRERKSVIQSHTQRIGGNAGNQTQVSSDLTASTVCLEEAPKWGFWKVWIKSSRISSRRQITKKCLFANTNWISVTTALQLMHFCCIGDWCVCVWCLRIAGRHILCLENDLEGLASRVCSQGPVISFERYHCECHGNFSFGTGSEGAVWAGGIPRSLQRLSWGP